MIIPSYAMPVSGLIGGLMIGMASAVMLLGAGRIAGVSGMAARATGISREGAPRPLALAFVLGLPLGALLASFLAGPVVTRFPESTWALVLGGLLVGIGTRFGSGCTSGHGVCGLSRLSRRSLVATPTFMLAAILTVTAMRWLGIDP